jgi:tetratricopeptide (TPR) repeat protein
MSTPSLPQFNFEIGTCLSRGDWHGAGVIAQQCRSAYPDDSSGWLLGSMAALFADQKEHALALVERAVGREPANVQAHLQRAECLFALGRRDEALASAECAMSAADGDAPALDAIGTFFSYASDYARALSAYDRAVLASPHSADLHCSRAAAHQYLGQFEAATRDYQRAVEISPGHALALKGLTELRRDAPEADRIADMEFALATTGGREPDATLLHFALAKTLEDAGEHARSWDHLVNGNRRERARLKYDPRQDRETFEALKGQFRIAASPAPDPTGESPIFIVGLPRTGTTLVERIIGAHSQIHSGGELSALHDAIAGTVDASFPQASHDWQAFLKTLGSLDARRLAEEYLARTRAYRGDKARFSDKTTNNFFYLPLIFRAFPNARAIHLTRHPLAACYAIYKTRFSGAFPFAYDLDELADFYIGYRDLMRCWHRILPGRILDVAYEDMVTQQQATTTRLLDYVGVPFEAACLDFQSSPDAVATASSVQVRQPLYDSSLEQWRHFTVQLAPLSARLTAAGIEF